MSGYRKPYTREEEIEIVRYILDSDEVYKIKGREFWMEMEKNRPEMERTWQSIKEHFLKKMSIKINMGDYNLTSDQRASILEALKPKQGRRQH